MKMNLRNGVWYIHFVDSAGQRKRISTGTADEALANVKAVEIMREHMVETLPDVQRKKLAQTITIAGTLATAYEKIWAAQSGCREKRYTIGKVAREIGHWPLQQPVRTIALAVSGIAGDWLPPFALSVGPKGRSRRVGCGVHFDFAFVIASYASPQPAEGLRANGGGR